MQIYYRKRGNKVMKNTVIKVKQLDKVYRLYDKPIDRLKEALAIGRKKQYHKEYYALQDINFEIEQGETIGIIGTNGSGKSTLLKIITGVLSPTAGTVEVKGKVSALLELGAGFNPEYTGIENIYLNGTMLGYSKEEVDAKIDEILAFADIGDFVYQPVKTYSSGMFVRLAFAVAINVDPEILIVDEALSVGDAAFSLKCMDKMRDFMNQGKTVIFVTHDVQTIKSFCSRAIWIERGKMMAQGDASKIVNRYTEFLFNSKYQTTQRAQSVRLSSGSALSDHKGPSISKLDPNYYKRWGDKQIEIIGLQMKNSKGQQVDTFEWNTMITVEILAVAHQTLTEECIGMGFAFRNNKALDIVTVTSIEENRGITQIDEGQEIYLKCEINNLLAPGDYSLVVNIESRKNEMPVYFDFIEGAIPFKVIGEGKFFSLIKQNVRQDLQVN